MESSHAPPGRVALVTGGAGGIGRAICSALAARSHRVAVADLDIDAAADLAARIDSTLGRNSARLSPEGEREPGSARERSVVAAAMGVRLDVTSSTSVREAVAQVMRALGPIEILVNNAGWDELKPFVETDEAFWEKVIDINFTGALRVTRAVLPGMIDAGWGRVVSISSDAARVGSSGEAVYAGAKGAIVSFTKSIARETARSGVTANAVCPGPTDTPLLHGIAEASPDAGRVIDAMTRAVPMRRLGRPEDIAGAVAFLASEDASYLTGQTLSVSGGLTMA